jgi:hypothetical protein
METLCRYFGFSISLTQKITMRFPLYATLVLALFACAATMGMAETPPEKSLKNSEAHQTWEFGSQPS